VGRALRRYRENLGYTLSDAALVLECHTSKVSRGRVRRFPRRVVQANQPSEVKRNTLRERPLVCPNRKQLPSNSCVNLGHHHSNREGSIE
jgi:hypothetical protein